jgi:hypothetical protein
VRTLNNVHQLPHIARPRVTLKDIQSFFIQAALGATELLTKQPIAPLDGDKREALRQELRATGVLP